MFNFSLNRRDLATTAEERFWKWFQKNRRKIEYFIDSDSQNKNYSFYKEFSKEMKRYNANLHPELTKSKDEQYVLIITPDGIKEGIEPTKKLAENQPDLKNWIIKKFRQPKDEVNLNFNGIEYPSTDIKIIPEIIKDEEKVDIEVYIRNMNKDEKKYKHLAFLYLDHVIGEFNTITKVRFINFNNLEKHQELENSISLLELRKLIENELY